MDVDPSPNIPKSKRLQHAEGIAWIQHPKLSEELLLPIQSLDTSTVPRSINAALLAERGNVALFQTA
jgi:hypothetical protein